MKYFIIRNGGAVIEKQVLGGEDSAIASLVQDYQIRHPAYVIQEVDQATFNATPMDATTITAADRASALALFLTDPSPNAKLMRAILLVILDEVNVIRGLISQPSRTVTQFRTAVQNKLNSGAAD